MAAGMTTKYGQKPKIIKIPALWIAMGSGLIDLPRCMLALTTHAVSASQPSFAFSVVIR